MNPHARRVSRRGFLGTAAAALLRPGAGAAATDRPPNVLFLAVDDMNDWVGALSGYSGSVFTPNMDRLAARGVTFTNAQCPSPLCGPSRTAILLGQSPSRTGIYGNGEWWLPNRPDAHSLFDTFRHNGYTTLGAGKLHHHTAGFNPPRQWDEYPDVAWEDGWDRTPGNYPHVKRMSTPEWAPVNGMQWDRRYPHEFDWGALPGLEEGDYADAKSAAHAVRFLQRDHAKPFMVACGIFRPHVPLYVPQRYLDLYPLDDIELPLSKDDDWDDLPPEGKKIAAVWQERFDAVRAQGQHEALVQAYLASITFADAQLGKVLDALDASPHADNTVVVLWSDHGWHLGEKNRIYKKSLWEESARVPFIWAGPGIKRKETVAQPVSLLNIYRTLLDLCGLPNPPQGLDGHSLRPLLDGSATRWDHPAITEFRNKDTTIAAIRTERWRYIQYRTKTGIEEELYDHETDPNEWRNLASDAANESVLKGFRQQAPRQWAEPAQTKRAYAFDPDAYTWKHRATGKVTDGRR
ncbi:MAG: sulfatase [bacterium]|nr:sulfatase [bacterium]